MPPPSFPRASIIALLPLCLLLALTCLSAAPAHASYWTVHISGSGTGTATSDGTPATTNWSPPADATNSNGFSFGSAGSVTAGTSAQYTATLTATVTLTWHAIPATDPAPTSIIVQETASAAASAKTQFGGSHPQTVTFSVSGSDGLSSTSSPSSFMSSASAIWPNSPSVQSGSASNIVYTPFSVSGGSVTFTRTLTCSASAQGQSVPTVTGSVSYNVSIHAQPYNFHLNGYTDNTGHHDPVTVDNINGILQFHYFFNSTDGNLADLSDITMYETLDWSGNSQGTYQTGGYAPLSPPVAKYSDGSLYGYSSPAKGAISDPTQGVVFDTFSPPTTGFVSPFVAASWNATQNYKFDDSKTGEIGTLVPGPDNHSPFTIARTVTPGATTSTGTYKITRDGYSATKSLP